MRGVYKYTLEDLGTVPGQVLSVVTMPPGAQVLHADFQPHLQQFAVWALVDKDVADTGAKVDRIFQVVGTGNFEIGVGPIAHVDTVLVNEGTLVFHVFELLDVEGSRAITNG